MRVVVLGTGALGCVFAARLAPHAEVWMLGTWPEAVAAIRRNGISVHEPSGVREVQVAVASDPAHVPPAGLALVLVKSYQTGRAAAWARQVLAPDGVAITLQNGLDNVRRLGEVIGPHRVIAGATFEGANVLEPGVVRHAGRGPTWLGGPPEVSAAAEAAAGLLRAAGLDVQVVRNIDGILWGKAVVNAAINPLTALWRVPNGDLLASDERRDVLHTLAREAASVAAARGTKLPFADEVARVEEVCLATAANRSSTLQDVASGRPTEIDSINGAIVTEGWRCGVLVTMNEAVWRLVRAL